MTIEQLQFFHAELNHMFFDGKLEPALVINPYDEEYYLSYEDDTEADFVGTTDPFIIRFYFDVENHSDLYTVTVLLHEMIHQYCAENGIEDINLGEHTERFRDISILHGLDQGGYKLTADAEAKIETKLAIVRRFTEMGIRKKKEKEV